MIAWVLFAVALGLLAISIYRVRTDLRRDDLLTRSTAVAVWLTYIVHGAAVLWAAIARVWPIPLSEISAHRLGGVLIVVRGLSSSLPPFGNSGPSPACRAGARTSSSQPDPIATAEILRMSVGSLGSWA